MDEVFWCVKWRYDKKSRWRFDANAVRPWRKIAIRDSYYSSTYPDSDYEKERRKGLARCVKVRIQEVEE